MGNHKAVNVNEEWKRSIRTTHGGIEQPIIFYIEVYGETSAYYMAARLKKENWDVQLLRSGSGWICLANAIVTPDDQTINDLCDYLSDLSEFYGGSFKRWELGSPV